MSDDTNQTRPARSSGRGFAQSMVVVAIAAILGAAGTVAVSGSSNDDSDSLLGWGSNEWETVHSPLIAPKPFHPRTDRGAKLAKVSYTFVYRVLTRRKETAKERIARLMEVINHETVRILMGRSEQELKSAEGQIAIERDLIQKLRETVFVDNLIQIDRILWDQVLVR